VSTDIGRRVAVDLRSTGAAWHAIEQTSATAGAAARAPLEPGAMSAAAMMRWRSIGVPFHSAA